MYNLIYSSVIHEVDNNQDKKWLMEDILMKVLLQCRMHTSHQLVCENDIIIVILQTIQ